MPKSGEINDIGLSPSFNLYSDVSLTSTAAARVSREAIQERAAAEDNEFSDTEEDDFEFSLEFGGEKFSQKDLELDGRIILPIFNTDLVTKDEVEVAVKEAGHDDLIIPLEKMLISDGSESESQSISSTSSEADEFENTSSATGSFCVSWRKARAKPPPMKKSRSTGSEESGSGRWRIKDIFRRSNSTGKETVYFVCPKRFQDACKKGLVKSGGGQKVAGKSKMKSSPSIHELFYVQKRAEQKEGKMKSYLPYRQDILGFKVHVNGNSNRKLPF